MKSLEQICKRAIIGAVMSRYIEVGVEDSEDEELGELLDILWRFADRADLIDTEVNVLDGDFYCENNGMVYWQAEAIPALLWVLGLQDSIDTVLSDDPVRFLAESLVADGDPRSIEEIIDKYTPSCDESAEGLKEWFRDLGVEEQALAHVSVFADRILPLDATEGMIETWDIISRLASYKDLNELMAACRLRSAEDIGAMFCKYYYYHWACVDSQVQPDNPDNIMSAVLDADNVMERRRALQWVLSEEEDWFCLPMDT